ncbi:class I SAM-dependent methyltransferase [Actinospica durhamensis]|uniref:Class I SAM-dependent methyltransferase n=1 Tax=Actinospica durhamensis TaxID=1508375 RepID=A0A941IRI1_9ACTN|nr:class I SAM-dependent methyltransferase [Actinospica durhamensis]MBR7835332.1 class I SAM-dependent methyltransferase [Actinospica durhamensis]
MVETSYLDQSYKSYADMEDEFQLDLDGSLDPRGPGVLYGLVDELNLSAGALALDVGCGEGGHAIELARRFALRVRGFEPVARHLRIARTRLAAEVIAARLPGLADAVSFEPGTIEELPVDSGVVDLVWCRDVLGHVEDLAGAYAEIARVLTPGGSAVVYQMYATDRLEPAEGAWLFDTLGCVARNMRPEHTEAAIEAAGLRVQRRLELGSEWGEYAHEHAGDGARRLVHAARLLRDPDRYVHRFGRENYDYALGDCLWHVYRMIGKLAGRAYLLRRPV